MNKKTQNKLSSIFFLYTNVPTTFIYIYFSIFTYIHFKYIYNSCVHLLKAALAAHSAYNFKIAIRYDRRRSIYAHDPPKYAQIFVLNIFGCFFFAGEISPAEKGRDDGRSIDTHVYTYIYKVYCVQRHNWVRSWLRVLFTFIRNNNEKRINRILRMKKMW